MQAACERDELCRRTQKAQVERRLGIELPEFIEYFLGDALYKLRKNEESSRFKASDEFDWKLDQFKR